MRTDKQSVSIRTLYLEKLLTEACELLIIFKDGNIANDDDKKRINALFTEISKNKI